MLLTALKEKRTNVVAELKRLQMETEPIIKIFEDEDVLKIIQNTRLILIAVYIWYQRLKLTRPVAKREGALPSCSAKYQNVYKKFPVIVNFFFKVRPSAHDRGNLRFGVFFSSVTSLATSLLT